MTTLSTAQLERVQLLLSGVQDGAQLAMAHAINRGLSRANTQTKKEIKRVYAVKKPTEASTVSIKSATKSNVVGHILYAGYKIPLFKFNTKVGAQPEGRVPVMTHDGWRMMRPGAAVSANILKANSPKPIKGAFVGVMGNGHMGAFERLTSDTQKVAELMGLSTAQMAGRDENLARVTEEVAKTVDERLEHEITRILNGYGGKR